MEHLRSREASWQARNMPHMAAYYRRPLERVLAGDPVDFDSWQLCNVVPTLTALDGRWRLQPDGVLEQIPPRRFGSLP